LQALVSSSAIFAVFYC